MDTYKVTIPSTGATLILNIEANSEKEARDLAIQKCYNAKLNIPKQENIKSWIKVYKNRMLWQ